MKKVFFMLFPAIIIVGCKKDFLADKAFSVITQENYYKSSNDAITALSGVYQALTANGMYETDMMRLNEYTSEAVTTRLPVNDSYSRFDTWKFQPGDFSAIYTGNYRLIERANQVLANVPATDMAETLRKRILGEATFLRALAYFNLVRVYGGVPLKIKPTTDFSETSFERASAAMVYEQIINDLTLTLQSSGIPTTSSYGGSDKGRVGRSAVQALLGKVYLTRASDATVAKPDDYQKAVQVLKSLVDENDRSLQTSYSNLFSMTNENNSEVIFDVQYIRRAGSGGNLTAFLPTGTTQELYQISFYDFPAIINFYKSFENNDQRRSATFYDRMKVKIGSENAVEVYFDPEGDPLIGTWRRADNNTLVPRAVIPNPVPGFRKFVDTDLTARLNAEEPNYIVLRYADVLLMLAEALNEVNGGPTADAYNYLNMVKRRAYSKPINMPDASVDYAGLDKQNFKEAIYKERKKEFVIEGHSWFDGKRFWEIFTREVAAASVGADPNISNRPKELISLSVIRDEKNKLLPFSQSQLDLNPQLLQNPGY